MKIEIDDDYLDEAVRRSLMETYKMLRTKPCIPFVSTDKKIEKAFVTEMRAHVKAVHNWYAFEEDKIK